MFKGRIRIMSVVLAILLVLTACGKKKQEVPIEDADTTDQMYQDRTDSDMKFIFQMDGKTYMISPAYEIGYIGRDLEEGCFYELTADITYLNGGIAGYVDFPQIDRVIDCKKISWEDIDLPDIREKRYGLMKIGDYADGDLFVHEYRKMALLKDGKWSFYDKELEREDGTLICFRNGVEEAQILEGIANGVLSCEDYFVQPAIEEHS